MRKGANWSDEEVELTVAKYFQLLELELRGTPFVKTEHCRELAARLEGRSTGAVEFKHGNISAVLLDIGLRPIDGYKPYGNFQRSKLPQAVAQWLSEHPEFMDLLESVASAPPKPPDAVAESDMILEQPTPTAPRSTQSEFNWRSVSVRTIDYAAREHANRRLGHGGEQLVVDSERSRLCGLGRDDLAGRVEHVADTRGDGLGFDVLSFDVDNDSAEERLIEVKTTRGGGYQPFYVTRNELRCSKAHAPDYRLYRVYRYGDGHKPRVFVLHGDLMKCLHLDPVSYRAVV